MPASRPVAWLLVTRLGHASPLLRWACKLERSPATSRAIFMPMTSGIDWLNIDRRTLFLLTADGRIERENDPDHSPGPRFWLARCQEGKVFGIRADFPDDGAAELDAIATTEPRFTLPVTPPRHLDRYAALVAGTCGVARRTFGLIYELPHSLRYESHAQLIGSDSEEGQRLWAVLVRARNAPGRIRARFSQRCGFLATMVRRRRRWGDRFDCFCCAPLECGGGAWCCNRESLQRARPRGRRNGRLVKSAIVAIARTVLHDRPREHLLAARRQASRPPTPRGELADFVGAVCNMVGLWRKGSDPSPSYLETGVLRTWF